MERTASADRTSTPAGPDYEADDVLVVTEPEQLRALGDDLRGKIVVKLRERARSISELAEELELPKGTVGHHVKVLEKAGLLRVVRTRRVRALTERYYGRVARLFVVKGEEYPDEVRAFVAGGLRLAAEELRPARADQQVASGYLHARLTAEDARRFNRRLERLLDDFRRGDTPDGDPYALVGALYPTEAPRG